AGAAHRACSRRGVARQHLGQGRLAGPVAAHQADFVTRTDPEGHVLHQESGADAYFDLIDGDHEAVSLRRGGSGIEVGDRGRPGWRSTSMRFNDNADLDTSRVEDGGGSGGGGIGGSGIGLPHIAGGGIVGLIITIIIVLVQSGFFGGTAQTVSGGLRTTSLEQSAASFSGSSLSGSGRFDYSSCKTGRDANAHSECALVAVENSLTNYWSNQPDVKDIWKPEAA